MTMLHNAKRLFGAILHDTLIAEAYLSTSRLTQLLHLALQIKIANHYLGFEVKVGCFGLLLKLAHGGDVGY